jgi:hypothetical protein
VQWSRLGDELVRILRIGERFQAVVKGQETGVNTQHGNQLLFQSVQALGLHPHLMKLPKQGRIAAKHQQEDNYEG